MQEFKIESIEKFPTQLQELLDKQWSKIEEIANGDGESYKEILKPMQDLESELEVYFTPLSHLNSVNNSEETKKAYEESLPKISKFHSQLVQNEKLFSKIEKLSSSDLEESKVIEKSVQDFTLAGAKLPMAQKQELEEIHLKLSELSNKFFQNLLDANGKYELIIENEKDVEGLLESDLSSAKVERDGKSVYRFTLQIPSYLSYITYGVNRKYREELYRAYSTRASENGKIIDEILQNRAREAKLLGFKNYAELSLASKDASSPAKVVEFLEELLTLVKPQAVQELEELKRFALELDGIEDLQPFDVAYYSEKLKKQKFNFDESSTKPYFEQGRVLKGLLDMVSTLFSMEFKASDTPTWHSSVQVFDIYRDGELLGRLYFDLEVREEKRGGAWMNNWQTHFVNGNNQRQLPVVFVVANFPAPTETNPSLLRHDDVVTLFHEMGHAIHHLFSKCREFAISGVNGTAWDVVEFPSQFLENFAYERGVIEKFAKHHITEEPLSEELLHGIKASKNFQSALGMLRQIEFALFDMKLHLKLYQGDEVQTLLDKIREETALIKVPSYNKFQHGFGHIFSGGYSAGYYSYKWAEVLSADAFFECLDENGEFNQDRANGYYNYILSRGSSENMSELYRKWLGRDAKLESLLKLYGIEQR